VTTKKAKRARFVGSTFTAESYKIKIVATKVKQQLN
jgi:hypothetical protein